MTHVGVKEDAELDLLGRRRELRFDGDRHEALIGRSHELVDEACGRNRGRIVVDKRRGKVYLFCQQTISAKTSRDELRSCSGVYESNIVSSKLAWMRKLLSVSLRAVTRTEYR